MKMKVLLTMLMVTGMMSLPALHAQVIPSNVWSDFGGTGCTINGVLAPINTDIDAYDPQGVHCGHQTTFDLGKYKLMAVYGDYLGSPEDEGCELGDHVSFKVNGKDAYELGPDNDTWDGQGAVKIMTLATSDITIFAVQLTAPPEGTGKAATTVDYQVSIKNNGDGVDLIKVLGTSSTGWTVTGANPLGDYFNAGEIKNYMFHLKIPGNATVGHQDTLNVIATSRFSPSANDSKKIVTTVDQSTDVHDVNTAVPGEFSLDHNFPNPFNPETSISFKLEKPGVVSLTVYDILGHRITTLHEGFLTGGMHTCRWNGTDQNGSSVASGIYFYRLTGDQRSITRKMALLK